VGWRVGWVGRGGGRGQWPPPGPCQGGGSLGWGPGVCRQLGPNAARGQAPAATSLHLPGPPPTRAAAAPLGGGPPLGRRASAALSCAARGPLRAARAWLRRVLARCMSPLPTSLSSAANSVLSSSWLRSGWTSFIKERYASLMSFVEARGGWVACVGSAGRGVVPACAGWARGRRSVVGAGHPLASIRMQARRARAPALARSAPTRQGNLAWPPSGTHHPQDVVKVVRQVVKVCYLRRLRSSARAPAPLLRASGSGTMAPRGCARAACGRKCESFKFAAWSARAAIAARLALGKSPTSRTCPRPRRWARISIHTEHGRLSTRGLGRAVQDRRRQTPRCQVSFPPATFLHITPETRTSRSFSMASQALVAGKCGRRRRAAPCTDVLPLRPATKHELPNHSALPPVCGGRACKLQAATVGNVRGWVTLGTSSSRICDALSSLLRARAGARPGARRPASVWGRGGGKSMGQPMLSYAGAQTGWVWGSSEGPRPSNRPAGRGDGRAGPPAARAASTVDGESGERAA
jgi:hypothetical protein